MPTLRAKTMHNQDHKPDYEMGELKKGRFEKTADMRRREREAKGSRSSRADDPNYRKKTITDRAGRTRTVYVKRHQKVRK